jgi:hypothetical protein
MAQRAHPQTFFRTTGVEFQEHSPDEFANALPMGSAFAIVDMKGRRFQLHPSGSPYLPHVMSALLRKGGLSGESRLD